MSVREVPGYTIQCDWIGCDMTADEGGDYAFWGEIESAWMVADDSDGWKGHAKHEWYCNAHPAAWSSDHEDGDPYPAPPFLLIHDGDSVDDGSVSLIAHLHTGLPCVPGGDCPTAAAAKEAAQYDALIEVRA